MVQRLESFAKIIASVLLLLICILTFSDVIGRDIFNRPVPGATELTELGLVGITFLIYPQIAYRQQHIAIDLFDPFMGVLAQRLQQALSGLLGLVVFGGIGWRLLILAERSANYGDITAYWRIPIAIPYYFMSVFSVLTAFAFLFVMLLAFVVPPDELNGRTAKKPSGLE